MKRTKIIYILSHIPPKEHIFTIQPERYFDTPEKGKWRKADTAAGWVGFFALDHHVQAAQSLLAKTGEFDIECWRPYGFGLKQMESELVNGITHRVFPAYKINIPQFGSLTWSSELLRQLKYEINTNNVILNLSVGHAWFHILLMLKLKKIKNKFGLIAVHRSGGFRSIQYKRLSIFKRLIKWYYHIETYFDARSLEVADYYLIGALPEVEYIKKRKWKISGMYYMDGIDFTKYRVLTGTEKKQLRMELGLPVEKNIFIVSGNWKSKDYAYETLLNVYSEVMKNNLAPNLQLVMIGGHHTDDLYEYGKSCGAMMIEKTSKSRFIKYLEASDFYGQPNLEFGFITFGGFGTAMLEALACGLPVISNNIIHFPGTLDERAQIGLECKTPSDLKKAVIFLNENYDKYKATRELAKKYYDVKNTENFLLSKYKDLEKRYFSTSK